MIKKLTLLGLLLILLPLFSIQKITADSDLTKENLSSPIAQSELSDLSNKIIQYLEKNPDLLDDLMDLSITRYVDRQKKIAELDEQERAKLDQEQAKILLTTIKESDHILGPKDAQFILIDYSDFQCPFCKRFHQTSQQFIKNYPEVALIYRHFPLPSHEPLASKQAIAAECIAQINGKDSFWPTSDLIFKSNPNSDQQMVNLALQLGVPRDQFLDCFINPEALEEIVRGIEQDVAEGQSAGVRGTPGVFFINTKTNNIKVIPGAVGVEYLANTLNQLKSE